MGGWVVVTGGQVKNEGAKKGLPKPKILSVMP